MIEGQLLLPLTIEHTIDERSPLCGHTYDTLTVRDTESAQAVGLDPALRCGQLLRGDLRPVLTACTAQGAVWPCKHFARSRRMLRRRLL